MTRSFGVGILGAGPVTQAIHLPTLARMQERFRVINVMDIDEAIASSVAARVGARTSASAAELLGDPEVDVVVVCSPHRFHGEQVEAAMRAGKKAVLCEKPLALTADEGERVAAVSRETGVPVVVGAMHTFDPGWLAAEAAWGELQEDARLITSSIVLPWNARYEDWATQILLRPPAGDPAGEDPTSRSGAVRDAVLGLAVHNLPHVRRFIPRIDSIEWAEWVDPYGYLVVLQGEGRVARLIGNMHGYWKPSWAFEVFGAHRSLRVEFPPSYVHAGSSSATLSGDGVSTRYGGYPSNGYEEEWKHVWDLANGSDYPAEELRSVIDDLTYAVSVADAAGAFVLAGGTP